jgi:hypothetical protein
VLNCGRSSRSSCGARGLLCVELGPPTKPPKGSTVDLYQAELIELPQLQRRAANVAARHRALQAKRTGLAEQRVPLEPSPTAESTTSLNGSAV